MSLKSVFTAILLLVSVFLFAQEKKYWEITNVEGIPQEDVITYSTDVLNPIYFTLDSRSVSTLLSNAPNRFETTNSPVKLNIPNPQGQQEIFEIFSTLTMSPELSEQLPDVKSFVGRNVTNPLHVLRITITPQGFFGMTTGSDFGQTYINPYAKNTNVYTVFSKRDTRNTNQNSFECGVNTSNISTTFSTQAPIRTKFISEGILRKYRLGVATTVEYSDFHWQAAGLAASASDTQKKNAVQAAIVVTIDRVNQIYERDLGVTLELITNNQDVIYLGDATMDPYTNNSGSTMLGENQATFNSVIGSGNYDIGHVFSTGGGGIASTPSVCNTNFKARGVTGQGNPVGDFFDIDYVAHEMGHQFGANHTQNNSCQRNSNTAVEPGSANTIMGYAGICAPNVQNNSDAMFHYVSILEISNFFTVTNNLNTGNCATEIIIANDEPTITQSPNYVIPKSTPFLLEATATDSNGDILTYSWEQIDNDVAAMPPLENSTIGPSFRTYLPTASPIRYFPAMSTLITNSYSNTWEVLPSVSRTMNFGLVVRDNNILGGQVSTETSIVTVNDAAGPFRVTSQNTAGNSWVANSSKTITWDIANTDDPSGVNAQNVDVLLSTDNGLTYPTILIANTPNDGSADIIVPDVQTSNARIMVKASDNVFFDINTQAFSIGVEFMPVYCDAGAAQTNFTNISRIEFNTIDNSSSTSSNGYEDYSNLYTLLSRGESYTLTASSNPGPFIGDELYVWIDYNKNGSFLDPGEQVINDDAAFPYGGNITIPNSAFLGETRMRVRINNADNGTSNTTPCGDSSLGEVEDYTVVIYEDYVHYDNTWTPTNPSGVSTTGDNILVVDGEPTLTGTTESNDLTILPFKTLNTDGILNVNGDITNDGKLVFKSNSTTTGQLDTFNGSISGEGSVIVERFIPGKRAYRFLSSSVTTNTSIKNNWQEGAVNAGDNPNPGYGTHITGSIIGANGFDATGSGNASMFGYDNINQTWTQVLNTDVNTLTAGTPYRLFVRGSRIVDLSSNLSPADATTLKATGSLVTGDVTVSNIGSNAGEFNFIGNPYQSSVDMNLALASSSNINPNFYYAWDPQLGARGSYVTVNLPAGSNTSGSMANRFLQPGQSIFVTTLANGAGNVLFTEAHKAAGENTNTFSTPLNYSSIIGQLYRIDNGVVASSLQDSFGIFFNSTFSNAVNAFDASKIFNQDESIAVAYGASLLAVDNRQLPHNSEVIQLSHHTYRTDTYQYKLMINNVYGKLVYLEDTYLGTMSLLNDGVNLYNFTIDASNSSAASDRFQIKIEDQTLGMEENELSLGLELLPNPVNSDFAQINIVSANSENDSSGLIYNLAGQKLFEYQLDFSNGSSRITGLSRLSSGVYFLKVTSGDLSQTLKFLKE